jgi:hypothetical protein
MKSTMTPVQHGQFHNVLCCNVKTTKLNSCYLCCFSPTTGEAEETSPDIVNEDAMEFKISSNSYKMKFVGGGRSFFYRKQSLPKARQVSWMSYYELILSDYQF